MHSQLRGILLILSAIMLGALSASTVIKGVDIKLLTWVAEHRFEHMIAATLALSNVFTPLSILGFAILAGALAWWVTSSRRAFSYIVFVVGAATLLSQGMKFIFQRPRPDAAFQVIPALNYAFPSGHVTGVVALSSAIVLLVLYVAGKQVALAAGFFAALLIGATAWSRVYLGVQWPSDIIAAALIGFGVALAASPILKAVEPEQSDVESSREYRAALR